MTAEREEEIMKILKEKYEKVKKRAEKQKQKWQFIINSENKNQLLNKSLDVMNFGGTSGQLVANQFIIGVDNESKNFYVFAERNSSIVGYAIYKLPFSYLKGIGEADGDDHWLKTYVFCSKSKCNRFNSCKIVPCRMAVQGKALHFCLDHGIITGKNKIKIL